MNRPGQDPPREDLAPLLGRMAGRRVLVLGDMVADEYIIGRPARMSREAPIPILEVSTTYVVPGGGANLAANLRALGAEVLVTGVVGDDQAGNAVRAALKAAGVGVAGLAVDAQRPTSTKTRVIGGSAQQVPQQVARYDRVDRSPVAGDARRDLLSFLAAHVPGVDALIISDYENGVISQEVIDAALPLAQAAGLIITVDSHGDLFRFKNVTAATPNEPEAEATTNRLVRSEDDLRAIGGALLDGMAAQGILITRGSEGMALFERGGGVHLLPVPPATRAEVRDATGAGDTVAATFTLALTAGATLLQAAQLSNVAASLVVRKFGVATVAPDELARAMTTG